MESERPVPRSVETYGLRVVEIPRPPAVETRACPGTDRPILRLCVSTALLVYFGAMSYLALRGVAWLVRWSLG